MYAGRSPLLPLVYFIAILALFFAATWAATHLLGLVLPGRWVPIAAVVVFAIAGAFGVGNRFRDGTDGADDSD